MNLKVIKFLFFTLLVLAFCPCRSATVGKLAPEFEAKLINGEKFSLAKNSGQVVLIHFWASWCEACKTEMPLLDSYFKNHHDEGLQLIAISMDTAKHESKARELMMKYSFSSGFAREASFKSFGRIWRLPLTFLIDRNRILQKDGWILDHNMTLDDLEKVIGPLLKEKKTASLEFK